MVDTSGAYRNSEDPKPKKVRQPRLKADAPDVKWDDEQEQIDVLKQTLNDPKTPWIDVRPPRMSPAELNLKLRAIYQIPVVVNRKVIDLYLHKVTNENHKYFLKRYAINGKEFDVCWLLLQEGI